MSTLFYYKKGVLHEKIRTDKTEVKRNKRKNRRYRRKIKSTTKSRTKDIKHIIVKRRKERTHRLITRRPILESLIENAEELTDEEIKSY